MTVRFWLAAPIFVAAGLITVTHQTSTARAAAPPVEGQDTSTLDDQTELALTVYNSDLALVRDVRNLQLPRGEFDLRFMDIAATVNPATVHLPLADRAGARSAFSSRTTSTTCSSPTSCCASTSAAT